MLGGARVGGNSDTWIQHIDGSELRQLTDDEAANAWPVWSPDGASVAYSSFGENGWETWIVSAASGMREKIFDRFFRGDWIEQPDGTGTWLVTVGSRPTGVTLFDFEQRTVVWEQESVRGSMPVFSPDGRLISARMGPDIWVLDSATGESHLAVRFPAPFAMGFRAGWASDGGSFIVTRQRRTSEIILLDSFWGAANERTGN